MIIYLITNKKNGKQYVGQTTRTLRERKMEHARKNGLVGRAIRKYGRENFDIRQIDSADSIELLNKKEIEWIEKLETKTPYGYNLCNGGNNTHGFNHREEARAIMAEKKKGMFKGKDNPFYGQKHSDETRKRMSEAWTEERKQQLAEMSRKRNLKNQAVRVRNIDTGEVFGSIKEAAETYNLKPTHITRVCRGRRKSTGGYRWEYVDKTIPSQADENQKV